LFILGRIITVIIAVIITLAALTGGYAIYLNANSARLPDREALSVVAPAGGAGFGGAGAGGAVAEGSLPELRAGTAYRAVTYNIGFGAYDHDYSFFMSEGKTLNGDYTKGLMSRAASGEAVKRNVGAAIDAALGLQPDIALFQEVDRSAGRSYRVDEMRMISAALDERAGAEGGAPFTGIYASNFHTGWLLWPPARPMGMVGDSGMATYSRYLMDSAERRSLPVDESFPRKFFDLDRCFTAARLPVGAEAGEGSGGSPGGELVLINVHLSAYKEGDAVRGEQMKVLSEFMADEREKGNWVIAGGDWSRCFPGSMDAFTGWMETPSWASPLDGDALPEGFSIAVASNAGVTATCRDSSIPWTPGVNYETIIDGWIVSDNVAAEAENIDTDYIASDHNPVLLTFTLEQ
jgi:endonuclease/exonuclease/phosphatase family metal-dependent hydrolase